MLISSELWAINMKAIKKYVHMETWKNTLSKLNYDSVKTIFQERTQYYLLHRASVKMVLFTILDHFFGSAMDPLKVWHSAQ